MEEQYGNTPSRFRYWLDLGFDVRSCGAFANHGIDTLEQLATYSEKQLLRMPNYGRKSLNVAKDILAERGFGGLSPDPDDAPDIKLARLYAKLAGHMEQVAAIKAQIQRIEAETNPAATQ